MTCKVQTWRYSHCCIMIKLCSCSVIFLTSFSFAGSSNLLISQHGYYNQFKVHIAKNINHTHKGRGGVRGCYYTAVLAVRSKGGKELQSRITYIFIASGLLSNIRLAIGFDIIIFRSLSGSLNISWTWGFAIILYTQPYVAQPTKS